MTPMRAAPAAAATALAVLLCMSAATAAATAPAPNVRLDRAALSPRAGTVVTVGVRVRGDDGALPSRCRLTVGGRRGGLGAPRGDQRVGPLGRVSWSWRLPVRTAPGVRRAAVRCQGARPRVARLTVRPPLFRAGVVRPELVERPVTGFPDERAFAYLLQVTNPRRDFDLVDVSIRVDLLDPRGGGITGSTLLIERIPAGGRVLAGDQVSVVGTEVPVRVRTRVDAAEGRAPGRATPEVRNLRLARTADGAELRVRGEVANPSFSPARPGDLTLALRDGAGRLVDVAVALTSGTLEGGGSVAFDEGFFGAGYLQVQTVEASVDAGR